MENQPAHMGPGVCGSPSQNTGQSIPRDSNRNCTFQATRIQHLLWPSEWSVSKLNIHIKTKMDEAGISSCQFHSQDDLADKCWHGAGCYVWPRSGTPLPTPSGPPFTFWGSLGNQHRGTRTHRASNEGTHLPWGDAASSGTVNQLLWLKSVINRSFL